MSARLRSFTLGLVLLAAGRAAGQPSTPGASQGLTPAAVALFTETAHLPATQTLLTAALADPNHDIRRLSARVARVTNSVRQQAALEQAIASEPADSGTRAEMEAALEALRGARPAAERSIVRVPNPFSPAPVKPAGDAPRVRLFPWLVPSLARDILRATGCKLQKDEPYIAAHVDYHQTGRIHKGALESQLLSEPCRRAGRVLTMLTIAAPGPIDAGAKEIVVMGFDRDWLECLEGRVTAAKRPVRKAARVGEDGVVAPTKTRNVDPAYPMTAYQQQIQGTVILDTLITSEGCVSELAVARSVHPQLDFAALRAVMAWRYAPAMVDGAPTPVFMTVTVRFSL
jgi:TonB family protein